MEFWLLALAWHSPRCCNDLESEQDGRILFSSLSLSLPLCLSNRWALKDLFQHYVHFSSITILQCIFIVLQSLTAEFLSSSSLFTGHKVLLQIYLQQSISMSLLRWYWRIYASLWLYFASTTIRNYDKYYQVNFTCGFEKKKQNRFLLCVVHYQNIKAYFEILIFPIRIKSPN